MCSNSAERVICQCIYRLLLTAYSSLVQDKGGSNHRLSTEQRADSPKHTPASSTTSGSMGSTSASGSAGLATSQSASSLMTNHCSTTSLDSLDSDAISSVISKSS